MPQPHPAFLDREPQASTGPEGGKQADKRMERLVERKGSGDALSQTPERILYRCSFAHNVPEMRETLPARNRVQQRAHLMHWDESFWLRQPGRGQSNVGE